MKRGGGFFPFVGLGILAFSGVLNANTAVFQLGSNPNQVYMGVNVGPYSGMLTGTGLTEFLGLDLNTNSNWNKFFSGTTAQLIRNPQDQAADEAAFLASYLLSDGAPSSNAAIVNNFEGPISFAIWQIMGTLGSTPPDPAAAQYVALAQDAYNSGVISDAFLSNFLVFDPFHPELVQRFIAAYPDAALIPDNPVPEAATWVLLALGLAGLAALRLAPGARK